MSEDKLTWGIQLYQLPFAQKWVSFFPQLYFILQQQQIGESNDLNTSSRASHRWETIKNFENEMK
jgi:hypothetical protein